MVAVADVPEEYLVAWLRFLSALAEPSGGDEVVEGIRAASAAAPSLGAEQLESVLNTKALDEEPVNEHLAPCVSLLLAVVEIAYRVKVACILRVVGRTAVRQLLIQKQRVALLYVPDFGLSESYELPPVKYVSLRRGGCSRGFRLSRAALRDELFPCIRTPRALLNRAALVGRFLILCHAYLHGGGDAVRGGEYFPRPGVTRLHLLEHERYLRVKVTYGRAARLCEVKKILLPTPVRPLRYAVPSAVLDEKLSVTDRLASVCTSGIFFLCQLEAVEV